MSPCNKGTYRCNCVVSRTLDIKKVRCDTSTVVNLTVVRPTTAATFSQCQSTIVYSAISESQHVTRVLLQQLRFVRSGDTLHEATNNNWIKIRDICFPVSEKDVSYRFTVALPELFTSHVQLPVSPLGKQKTSTNAIQYPVASKTEPCPGPARNSTHKKCLCVWVAVECMFSTMGLILNGKRSRFSGDKTNAISFIHDNFAFLDIV